MKSNQTKNKPKYIVVSRVRALLKEKGKRAGADFLALLDQFVKEKCEAARDTHDGSRVTVGASVAGHVGIKPRNCNVFGGPVV